VSLDSAGVEVSELETGWPMHVGKEFQKKGSGIAISRGNIEYTGADCSADITL